MESRGEVKVETPYTDVMTVDTLQDVSRHDVSPHVIVDHDASPRTEASFVGTPEWSVGSAPDWCMEKTEWHKDGCADSTGGSGNAVDEVDAWHEMERAQPVLCNSDVADKVNPVYETSMQQGTVTQNTYMPCYELPVVASCQSWESYPCTAVSPADARTYTPALDSADMCAHHDPHHGQHQHVHLHQHQHQHLHQHEHQHPPAHHQSAPHIAAWENSSVSRQPWSASGGMMPASIPLMSLNGVKNVNFQSGGAVSSASPVVQQYHAQDFQSQYADPQQPHYGQDPQYHNFQPQEPHVHQPPQHPVHQPHMAQVQHQYVQQLPSQQYFQPQQWAAVPTPNSHVHLPILVPVVPRGQSESTGDDRVYLPITKREDTIATRRDDVPWTCIGGDPATCPHAYKAQTVLSEDLNSARYDCSDATHGKGTMGPTAEDVDLWKQKDSGVMAWEEEQWMQKETQWIPQGCDAERMGQMYGACAHQEHHHSMAAMLPVADVRQRDMHYHQQSGVGGQHSSPELIKEKKEVLERQLAKLEKKQREIARLRQRPLETLDTFMQAKVHLDVAPALAKVRERLRNLVASWNITDQECVPIVCTPTTSAGAWDDVGSCLDTVSSVSDPIDPKRPLEHSAAIDTSQIVDPKLAVEHSHATSVSSRTTAGAVDGVPPSSSQLINPTHHCPETRSASCRSAHSAAGDEPQSPPESKKTRKKRHNEEKQAGKKEHGCTATPKHKLDRTRLCPAQHENAEADERFGAPESTEGPVVGEGAAGSTGDTSGTPVVGITQSVRQRLNAQVLMTWLAVMLALCFVWLLYSKISLLYSRLAFAEAVAASRNYEWETEMPHGMKLVAVVQQECSVEAKRIEAKIRHDRESREAKKSNAKTATVPKKPKKSAKKKNNKGTKTHSNKAPTTIDHITASMRDFSRNPDADEDDEPKQNTFAPLSSPWLRIGRAFFEQSKTLFQHLDVNSDRRLNKHEMIKGLPQKALDQWGRLAPENIMLSFGCSTRKTASPRDTMGTEPNFGRSTMWPSGISDRSMCKPCALPFQVSDCFLFVQQFTEFVFLYHAERRMSSFTSSFYAQNAKHAKGYKSYMPQFAAQDARRILQMAAKFYPNFRL